MSPNPRNRVSQFAAEESGVITILGIFLLMIMMMVGGLGVDFMHAEMRRTDLQHTLDRAVLAAADLDQRLDPADVVEDYFAKAGLDGYLTADPIVDDGLNYRTVSAQARISTKTLLLPLAGVKTLSNDATGSAEERIANVEISLVLDISGSMGSGWRMDSLQEAADTFIDTLLRPENDDLVSISVIPYSSNVNPGPELFAAMNTETVHSYSHCIEFTEEQFETAEYDSSHTYEQVPFFQYINGSYNDMTKPACPRYSYERISPFSQNVSALKSQVNSLQPRAYTSIFLGMKWGAMLLDPSMRPVISTLIDDGDIDSSFEGRPANYNDSETLKTIVLMTDGANVATKRIDPSKYNTVEEREFWSQNNLYWWPRNYDYYNRYNYYYQKYSSSQGDTLLENICDAARTKGIIVWSVGLNVSSSDLDVMRYCASSPGHFFETTEEDIEDVFSTIARQVNFLRLVQ